MSNIHSGIDCIIGNTPMIELKNIENEFQLSAKIFAKLEYLNPAGSVKDRVALSMLNSAEKAGKLTKDTVVIEPTSGNTGIGLAAICASRNIKCIIVMPDSMSVERQKLMQIYGAKLVLTDGSKGMPGAIEKANQLANEIDGAIIAGQFINPANPLAHYETTGPEILRDTDGLIDYFVCGVGTGGTITGTGQYLKQNIKDVKVVAVEPENSAVLSGGTPGKHGLQGIGAGFVPEILDLDVINEVITVSDADAFNLGKTVAQKEGILVGISSGAALFAAVTLAKRPENRGKRIVVLLPDTGDRYLSTDMFK